MKVSSGPLHSAAKVSVAGTGPPVTLEHLLCEETVSTAVFVLGGD